MMYDVERQPQILLMAVTVRKTNFSSKHIQYVYIYLFLSHTDIHVILVQKHGIKQKRNFKGGKNVSNNIFK